MNKKFDLYYLCFKCLDIVCECFFFSFIQFLNKEIDALTSFLKLIFLNFLPSSLHLQNHFLTSSNYSTSVYLSLSLYKTFLLPFLANFSTSHSILLLRLYRYIIHVFATFILFLAHLHQFAKPFFLHFWWFLFKYFFLLCFKMYVRGYIFGGVQSFVLFLPTYFILSPTNTEYEFLYRWIFLYLTIFLPLCCTCILSFDQLNVNTKGTLTKIYVLELC